MTKLEQIKARKNTQAGTYPGAGRSRQFIDRKKEGRRKECRKPYDRD